MSLSMLLSYGRTSWFGLGLTAIISPECARTSRSSNIRRSPGVWQIWDASELSSSFQALYKTLKNTGGGRQLDFVGCISTSSRA